MPRMVNGTGTWFCTAHYDTGWGWDDAVECTMFAYMPVWPIRVLHVQITPGGSFAPENYREIPLRWSDQLVRHVFLRCWLAGCIGLGILCTFLLVAHAVSPPQGKAYVAREWAVLRPILLPLAPCLIVGSLVGQFLIRRSIKRERGIRLLLGLHALGSSDPTSWPDNELARLPDAQALFGTATYAAAVKQLLETGAWAGAMWAARLAVAREGQATGDVLTAEVLQHPAVQESRRRYRLGTTSWREAMGAAALDQFQANHAIVEKQTIFDLNQIEQLTRQKKTQQSDEFIAGVAAVFALAGVGLGAWLGSMVNIQVALVGAVAGSVIGAISGALLASTNFFKR